MKIVKDGLYEYNNFMVRIVIKCTESHNFIRQCKFQILMHSNSNEYIGQRLHIYTGEEKFLKKL